MKNVLFLICVLISIAIAHAQGDIEKSNWSQDPKWSVLSDSLNSEPEIILSSTRFLEYAYSSKYNDKLVEYTTIHKKIRVNSDDAIEFNNKVYINMSRALELIDAKARVITPNNKIITFDTSNIKKSDGGDGKSAHTYFAIDGIEKGSDVEYSYTVLNIPNYDGSKIIFQSEVINQNVDFKLIAPENLLFDFRAYNGFPTPMLDTTREDKNVYSSTVNFIDKQDEEDYSAYEKSLQSVVYKLRGNRSTGKYNVITYGEISQNFYGAMYRELDKSSSKALDKLISASGAKSEKEESEKIRKLENYIKANIQVIKGADSKSISSMTKDNYGSPFGVCHLFAKALDEMGIEHELVLTTDRYDNYFDETFEHYQVLTNTMFYFPSSKKFLAPDELTYRYGIVPADWMGQKGLFIKKVTAGDLVTGVGRVKNIPALASDATADIMEINIGFSDMTQPVIGFKRTLSGYSAIYYQPIYQLINDDDKKNIDESLIKFSDINGEVIDYTVKGMTPEDAGVNPVVYEGKLKTTTLMEKAGAKYIFKVGEAIGPQAEMYQDTERSLDIEHDHNMSYIRTITFEIPEGYKVAGLESVNINEEYPTENPKIGFSSSFTQEGSLVTINVKEYYDDMFFNKTEILDFRRIINAAANFNKAVIFLEKI